MRIVHAAPYCKCAGVTSWLRYLIGATRADLAWHCWFDGAHASALRELGDLCDVALSDHFGFADGLRIWDPDVVVCSYKSSHYKTAFSYGDAPVVGVLHTRSEVYENLRPLLAKTDALVCPSATIMSEYAGWDGMERGRLIYHGVMLPGEEQGYDFKEKFDLPPDSYLVGWVGRLDLEKGWRELLRIADHMRGSRHHFIIAGVGGKTGTGEVATAVKNYDNLSWMAAVPMNSMPSFYAGLDAGLSTSPYEAFGLSVCEMAAHGLPIVARRGGAVGEVVGNDALIYDGTTQAVDYLDQLAAETTTEELEPRKKIIDSGFLAERMGRDYIRLFSDLVKG